MVRYMYYYQHNVNTQLIYYSDSVSMGIQVPIKFSETHTYFIFCIERQNLIFDLFKLLFVQTYI